MPVPRRVPPSTTSLSSSVSSLPSQSVPTACTLKMETCRCPLSSLASLGTAALPTNLFQRLCNHMPCLLSRRRGGCCASACMTTGCLGSVPLLPSSDPNSCPVAPQTKRALRPGDCTSICARPRDCCCETKASNQALKTGISSTNIQKAGDESFDPVCASRCCSSCCIAVVVCSVLHIHTMHTGQHLHGRLQSCYQHHCHCHCHWSAAL